MGISSAYEACGSGSMFRPLFFVNSHIGTLECGPVSDTPVPLRRD